jgi:thiol-disulfide isomerase/thioredoxin
VVINVWGSRCAPCQAETPDLVRLSHEFADRGVRFVGINTRDNSAAARAFERTLKVPYPSVEDQGGRLLLNFRHIIPTAVVPSSVVIDRDGKVAARVIGRVTYTTLKGLLEDELAADGGTK